jgi:hypothetical protein
MINDDWILCRDKNTKFYYWAKENRENDKFELIFSFYPSDEKGWEHSGIKVITKTLEDFLNNECYKKYQTEIIK